MEQDEKKPSQSFFTFQSKILIGMALQKVDDRISRFVAQKDVMLLSIGEYNRLRVGTIHEKRTAIAGLPLGPAAVIPGILTFDDGENGFLEGR
jgi:hypothetical protein